MLYIAQYLRSTRKFTSIIGKFSKIKIKTVLLHLFFLIHFLKKGQNEYLETLRPAPTQFCDEPGFYLKTGFLRSHPFSYDKYLVYSIIV